MRKPQNIEDVLQVLDFSERSVPVLKPDKNLNSLKSRSVSHAQEFGVDKIHFSGQFPTIYFKTVNHFDQSTLKSICEIHKKTWNERKVPFLFISSPVELRIYNCFIEPIDPERNLDKIAQLELFTYNTLITAESKLEELVRVFSRSSIDSGLFWKEKKYAEKLDANRRVDKALMKNLASVRRELIENGLDIDIVHDLLLRSLFILYLEDRGGTTSQFYEKYLKGAKSYFDILEDTQSTYNLYDKLERSFNGNLSPVSQKERQVVTDKHLKLIKGCFWSDLRSNTGQTYLFNWKVFDFSAIRIELISEIYEEFMSLEQGEDKTKNDGAYYTPHSLVDFILNEKLPWADKSNQNYDLKMLDPTCGSGIFLVESFKRLVSRWKFTHENEEINFDTLKKILVNSIYGIEINADAIKVAAFSLYLALLDYLNPRTLWQDKKFPYLIFDPENDDKSKQGKNLFRMSSLEKEGLFNNINYDLIVGNPPFKRGDLPTQDRKYLQKLDFAQEYVLAFLHRATELCPNGQIALVAASKILFNTTSGYRNFRNFLFNKSYVEAVYNFSALRKTKREYGGNLFASAVGPACVLFYQAKKPAMPSKKLLYCSPKTFLKNRLVDGVAIDVFDVKYIPREESSDANSKIWKVAMWGTERDFALIKRLSDFTSLDTELKKKKNERWNMGVGLQTSNPNDKPDDDICKIPHIDAEVIERYYSRKENTISIDTKMFRRLGCKEAYFAPHILIKEGQSNKRFCASFLNYDCSFTSTVFGISSKDSNTLKAITAYLNSSFSSYFLFLIASSWGVERERVKPNEIFLLPALPFFAEKEHILALSKKVDEITHLKKKEVLGADSQVLAVEQEIDEIIFKCLNLNAKDKILIKDSLEYVIDLFQEGENSSAYKRVAISDIEKYAKQLCTELNDVLQYASDNTIVSAKVYETAFNSPLTLVSITFSKKLKNTLVEKVSNSNKLTNLLKQIDDYSFEKHSESIYFRKVIKYFDNDTIYLIKPNEKRFWSRSTAMNDADEIMFDVINTQTNV